MLYCKVRHIPLTHLRLRAKHRHAARVHALSPRLTRRQHLHNQPARRVAPGRNKARQYAGGFNPSSFATCEFRHVDFASRPASARYDGPLPAPPCPWERRFRPHLLEHGYEVLRVVGGVQQHRVVICGDGEVATVEGQHSGVS